MATRTTQCVSTPSFIADPASAARSTGRQVDWANVDSSFAGSDGKKVIPAGHRVYETTEGKIIPKQTAAQEPLLGLIETNAIEGDKSAALSGYGVIIGGVVYTELLPETLDSTAQAELAAVGTGFAFETYSDSRAGS